MLFARGNKAIEREGVFPHMGVNQEGDFGVQLAQRGVSRERHLHEIADTAHVHEHLIRSFSGEASAKLANHRSPVLPLSLRPSTREEGSAAVFANKFGLGKNVALHGALDVGLGSAGFRSEEHTSELQSQSNLVCRLLL